MRLSLFELINHTKNLLELRDAEYSRAAYELQEFFQDLFDECRESFIGIQTRVKSPDSLREKILRKKLYQQYNSANDLLANLSDLIGIRAECRFIVEEKQLFETLKMLFKGNDENGLSYHLSRPDILLDLSGEQPQQQNNGLSIYRIDGIYRTETLKICFELQIKAMVHVFWSEVEHEIIYKSNEYRLVDGFLKEMMFSTYNNLESVDHQLYAIYGQMMRQEMNQKPMALVGTMYPLLAKFISDSFNRKIKQSLGFTLNIKKSCDILSHYLLMRNNIDFSDPVQINLMYKQIRTILSEPTDFEAPLELEGVYQSEDAFSRRIGEYLFSQLNDDYDWNLFFRMLFALERGNNLEDFTSFIELLRQRFSDRSIYEGAKLYLKPEELQEYQQQVLEQVAELFCSRGDISMIYEDTISSLISAIHHLTKVANSQPSSSEIRQALEEALD